MDAFIESFLRACPQQEEDASSASAAVRKMAMAMGLSPAWSMRPAMIKALRPYCLQSQTL